MPEPNQPFKLPAGVINSFEAAQRNFQAIERAFPLASKLLADDSVTGAKLDLEKGVGRLTGGNQTVNTTEADVGGCTYTTTRAGDWLVLGQFHVVETSAGTFTGKLMVDGVNEADQVSYAGTGIEASTITGVWTITGLAISKTIKMRCLRVGGGFTLVTDQCKLTVIQIG